MSISDLFSTSFLFSIAIIVILIGGIFAYVSYRMSEQDHKLSSMINLVSALAHEIQYLKSQVSVEDEVDDEDNMDNENNGIKLEYPTQLLGGNLPLINVSDDEDDEDEDEDDDEDDDDDTDNDGVEDDGDDDDEDEELKVIKIGKTVDPEDGIKRINLSPGTVMDFIQESVDNNFNEMVANDLLLAAEYNQPVAEDVNQPVAEDVNQPVEEDVNHPVAEDVNHPVAEDVNQPVEEDSKEEQEDLKELAEGGKLDYKKMDIHKLREIVVSKGLTHDASKLKRKDILKMLEDESHN
jgi:hypothetical protein